MPGSSVARAGQGLSLEPLVDPIGGVFAAYGAAGHHGNFCDVVVMHKKKACAQLKIRGDGAEME